MVTLTADVTDEIKKMAEELVAKGLYKSQSEVVRDAIRQLTYRYASKENLIRETRKISSEATKKSGYSLSRLISELRAE